MKTTYTCELCGASFDNFDAAYECEHSHISEFCTEMEPETSKYCTYATGERAPRTVVLCHKDDVWNADMTERQTKYTFYRYHLSRQPVTEQETAEILAEYEARKAKEAAWWEEYKAKLKDREQETA